MFYQSDQNEKKRSKSTINNRRDESMTVAERARTKRENMKEGIIDLKVDVDSGSDSEKEKNKNMNPIAVSGMPKPSDAKGKQWQVLGRGGRPHDRAARAGGGRLRAMSNPRASCRPG
jgi:hypothetical protein